jgi:undecaprenyl-diphosphatase
MNHCERYEQIPWLLKPAPRTTDMPHVWLWASVVLMILTGMLIYFSNNGFVSQVEQQIMEVFDQIRNVHTDHIFTFLTWSGSFMVVAPLLFAMTAVLLLRGKLWQALLINVTFFGASLNTWILKQLVDRERPLMFESALTQIPEDAAFPSGHTTHAAAAALCVWLVTRHLPYHKAIALALLGLVTGVGLSRIYLQVHWPTDVLGGAMIVAIWACIALAADHFYRAINGGYR